MVIFERKILGFKQYQVNGFYERVYPFSLGGCWVPRSERDHPANKKHQLKTSDQKLFFF